MKAFVDFYTKEGISPVSQDISDLQTHFRRRAALYRHLGIIPSLIKGRRVIEFGPGSGHNALYTASLQPGKYTLVEGNEVGLQGCRELFGEYYSNLDGVEFNHSLIEDWNDSDRYELVLCEGLLPLQDDPVEVIRHVAQFVEEGGSLVVTCTDSVSYLSELLRRLHALILTRPEQTTKEKVQVLLPIFSPQLAMIPGMSRPHDEYILDNIIQPFSGRKLFGVDDAIQSVKDIMTVYKTSPDYSTDWRWYKKITGPVDEYNDLGREAYFQNLHNLLDSRADAVLWSSDEDPSKLLSVCDAIYDEILCYETHRGSERVENVCGHLKTVVSLIEVMLPTSAQSINSFIQILEDAIAGKPYVNSESVGDWFGQAQVYVNFLKDIPGK